MPRTRWPLLTLLVSVLVPATVASSVAGGDGSPVVIDMPAPPGGHEPSSYQDHQNGDVSLGALALGRYSGTRSWPTMTNPGWGGPNVVGYLWASSFPPFGGGYSSTATWGYPVHWGWGWPRRSWGGWSGGWSVGWWGGWSGGCGVWGYPRWGIGRVSTGRTVRGPQRSFRLQPYR